MLALLYGVILTLVHFYNDEIATACTRWRLQIISLGAGVSIAYLFLALLPELYQGEETSQYIFISLLVGFTLFHLAEKHIYQHKSKVRILKEMKEVHSAAFFIYNILLGITLYYFASLGTLGGLLFFIPIFFHSAISNISLSEIHPHVREKNFLRIILASAPLFGIFIAINFPISQLFFQLILGFVIGALFYVVIRDNIPKEKEGNVHYFILGVILMLLIVLIAASI